jgi:hypothetical protein
MAHHAAGIRSDQVVAHVRSMRAHDDKIDLRLLRLFKYLVIHTALPHDHGYALSESQYRWR